MSDVKWIKITTDVFDDEKMFMIETLQDGFIVELIWFKILCLAGKCNKNGFLMINDKFPYTDEMLSKIFRMSTGDIKHALDVFQELNMIEVVNNIYMVSNWEKHQNISGLECIREQNRIRQKKFREKQKAIIDNENSDKKEKNVTLRNVTPSYSYSISSSLSNNSNIYKDIISYLNNKTNKSYRYNTKSTQSHINARLKEGFSLEDFKKVIDFKVDQWKDDPKMKQYLRPETLFGTKFESYLMSIPQEESKESAVKSHDDTGRFSSVPDEILEDLSNRGVINIHDETINAFELLESDIETLKQYGVVI